MAEIVFPLIADVCYHATTALLRVTLCQSERRRGNS